MTIVRTDNSHDNRTVHTTTNSWGETPKEIAEALSRALVYLRREADAVDGMNEVSALIQRACDAARNWTPASNAATGAGAASPGSRGSVNKDG